MFAALIEQGTAILHFFLHHRIEPINFVELVRIELFFNPRGERPRGRLDCARKLAYRRIDLLAEILFAGPWFDFFDPLVLNCRINIFPASDARFVRINRQFVWRNRIVGDRFEPKPPVERISLGVGIVEGEIRFGVHANRRINGAEKIQWIPSRMLEFKFLRCEKHRSICDAAFLFVPKFIDAALIEYKPDTARSVDRGESEPNFKEAAEFQVFEAQLRWRLITKGVFQQFPARYKIDWQGYVWTFPKGRPDAGETPERAALREVKEETGYSTKVIRKYCAA